MIYRFEDFLRTLAGIIRLSGGTPLKRFDGIALAACVLAVSGCATNSSNMRVGTDQSYMSLKDQREASMAVREYASMPEGATKIGRVDAARCHRNTLQTPPTDEEVKIDLKAAAYAKGADGITDIKITKVSGLLQNCWNILSGEATAIALRK